MVTIYVTTHIINNMKNLTKQEQILVHHIVKHFDRFEFTRKMINAENLIEFYDHESQEHFNIDLHACDTRLKITKYLMAFEYTRGISKGRIDKINEFKQVLKS